MMEENLFVNVEQCPVKHAASRFLSEKNVTKKDRKRVKPGWIDISGSGPVSFLSRSPMYYIMLTLHNPINRLNVVSKNLEFLGVSGLREAVLARRFQDINM